MKNVSIRVTYECGRCGNVQRRTYRAEDGLLIIPQAYCGCCTRRNNFTVMSAVVSDGKVTDANKGTTVRGPGGQCDVSAGGKTAETPGGTETRRVDAGKTGGEIGPARSDGASGVPPVPPKPRVPGKPTE